VIAAPFRYTRTAVRGCVSSTKTYAAALASWAWLLAHPESGRVFHLAPSFRQVDKNMWGYLRALDAKAKANGTPLGAEVYKEPRIAFTDPRTGDEIHGWEYTGFSTDNPHNVHGIHGPDDLIVLDDAHGIPKAIFDELENMFAGGNTRLLMLFNPVVLTGDTYECTHAQASLWHNIKISFDDLQRAYAAGHSMPGALQPDTVKTWAKKYGTGSSFYLPKVDAEYPREEKDQVVPLAWVEAACLRDVPEPGSALSQWLGHDVARFGDDESALCTIAGRRVLPIEAWQGARTTENAGKVTARIRKLGIAADHCAVDVIGVGSGVVDGLHENGLDVIPLNVAEASDVLDEARKPKFANLRSEIWWAGREALDPENADALALDPSDTQLHAELTAVKWKFDAQGRIKVESKEDMKKRLGYSPDRADAFNLAVYARTGRYRKRGKWRPID
jgi:phage terminase large subunit